MALVLLCRQCLHKPTADFEFENTSTEARPRSNRRRQPGDGESPTQFGSSRSILRLIFVEPGDKLVVPGYLRLILAQPGSKYSNTQHRIRNLEPQTDARNKFCGALDLNSKPAKTKRSRQIICQGFWRRLGGYAAAHVGSMRATVFRSVHVCGMLGPCKSVLRMA